MPGRRSVNEGVTWVLAKHPSTSKPCEAVFMNSTVRGSLALRPPPRKVNTTLISFLVIGNLRTGKVKWWHEGKEPLAMASLPQLIGYEWTFWEFLSTEGVWGVSMSFSISGVPQYAGINERKCQKSTMDSEPLIGNNDLWDSSGACANRQWASSATGWDMALDQSAGREEDSSW